MTSRSAPSSARLEAQRVRLRDGLHRAYCMAVCLDRALRYYESDDSPELAVCISEYLVRPLDALSIEADQLRQAFSSPENTTQADSGT